MRILVIIILLSMTIACLQVEPPNLGCDPEDLDQYDKGEMNTNVNDDQMAFFSCFKFFSDNLFGIIFNHPEGDNCYYSDKISFRGDFNYLLNTSDTISLLNTVEVTYFINASDDAIAAFYNVDTLKRSWLLINSINQDSSVITGEFYLDLIRMHPALIHSVDYPERIIVSNATFTSERIH